jgi:hypothetical protein
MTLDRRRFLQIAATGAVASLTTEACGRNIDEDERELAQPALLEMLGAERTHGIGMQYRAAFPKESTAAALRGAIASSRRQGFPWIWRQSIEEQVHDDFAAGRTVLISGWVLSLTEARQCALYSLLV